MTGITLGSMGMVDSTGSSEVARIGMVGVLKTTGVTSGSTGMVDTMGSSEVALVGLSTYSSSSSSSGISSTFCFLLRDDDESVFVRFLPLVI